MSDETVGVDTIATVQVPRSALDKDMSDEEIREAVIMNARDASAQELAQSISPIRKQLEDS